MAQQPILSNLPKEKVYYIGGFTSDDTIVTAMGKSYIVPPIGEFLEVEPYIVKALIRRNRNPKAGGMSVFTTDRRFAQAVANGDFVRPVVQVTEEKEWTRDELLAKLAELDVTVVSDEAKVSRTKKAKAEETE